MSITLLSCIFDIRIALSCILRLTLSIYVIYLSNISVLSRGFRARWSVPPPLLSIYVFVITVMTLCTRTIVYWNYVVLVIHKELAYV